MWQWWKFSQTKLFFPPQEEKSMNRNFDYALCFCLCKQTGEHTTNHWCFFFCLFIWERVFFLSLFSFEKTKKKTEAKTDSSFKSSTFVVSLHYDSLVWVRVRFSEIKPLNESKWMRWIHRTKHHQIKYIQYRHMAHKSTNWGWSARVGTNNIQKRITFWKLLLQLNVPTQCEVFRYE